MKRALLAVAVVTACARPGEDRAVDDRSVGIADDAGFHVVVTDRLGAVRALTPGQLELWASAPALEVTLDVATAAAGTWRITVDNALPDAELREGGAPLGTAVVSPRPTVLIRDVHLPAGRHVITIGPAAAPPGPLRVVAVADVQTGLPTVDQVFAAIATVEPRFVVFMGDITERGRLDEYALWERQLTTLPVPIYTTLGNHELWADASRYQSRFGPATYQFTFDDVAFTFADSGDADLDPIVEAEVEDLLAAAADRQSLFLTHFPPVDPVGVRDGAFRSRRDGQRLIGTLASAGVDLALYGHIHTYAPFEHAGIPAFVSGGGGARPERWDGIGRHFLVIDLTPGQPPIVGVRRVD